MINRVYKNLLIAIVFSVLTSSCVPWVKMDGPYTGKVVELETGEPIEGAVVAGRWSVLFLINTERICGYKETVTDVKGEFELPSTWCVGYLLAPLYKPEVVVFKPGYFSYPPPGSTQEERHSYMPDFTGKEFRDEKKYRIIRLGKPKTKEERLDSLHRAEGISHKKLLNLIKLTNEENRYFGFDIIPINEQGEVK